VAAGLDVIALLHLSGESEPSRSIGICWSVCGCWAADGQIAAFSSDGPHFHDPSGFYLRQSALRDVLASTDVALVTTIYAEKIFWRSREPSHDRGEMHAVIHHTEQGPRLASRTYLAAQLWHDDTRIEKRLE
jgi:hypothetical protein